MRFTGYSFGSIQVDGVTYDHDLILDRGKIRKRRKAASRKFRGVSGHTPLSVAEDIPWRRVRPHSDPNIRYGALPTVMSGLPPGTQIGSSAPPRGSGRGV
jgi:hypothetical protein